MLNAYKILKLSAKGAYQGAKIGTQLGGVAMPYMVWNHGLQSGVEMFTFFALTGTYIGGAPVTVPASIAVKHIEDYYSKHTEKTSSNNRVRP
ncbi:MAG: hypothetical protein JSS07_01145 [Proteobacteria bacterium]|nr:hypothetical protein [Pseudomonadota bacterium]